MIVKQKDIQFAIYALGLKEKSVCLHSSLSSFGKVDGGAATIIRSFLDEGCTILVPTFSWEYAVAPPKHLRFERNGWNYKNAPVPNSGLEKTFAVETSDIDRDMGAIPKTIVFLPERVRGNHPINSFTAVGRQARRLIAEQKPSDVYAPLLELTELKGFVLLMGVGLESMTLLHLAERMAGRTLFRRWANNTHGQPMAVEVGGCSEGFDKFESYLIPIMKTIIVGQSQWKLFPADMLLSMAIEIIRADPEITHCDAQMCERCDDAVAGGAIFPDH